MDMPQVAVMGGSLGGLTAALVLRDAGCDVTVFERSSTAPEGRGVGIVSHPMTTRYLVSNNVMDIAEVSTYAPYRRYIATDGHVQHEALHDYRLTAYNTLWRALYGGLEATHYHLDSEVVSFSGDDQRVTLQLANGQTHSCDLLVCADGIMSGARQLLLPDIQPSYAGYVAWRGVVDERDLSEQAFERLADAVTYVLLPDSHILVYPIPNHDGRLEPGRRLQNFVWYRNVAEGHPLDDLLTDREGRQRTSSLPPGTVRDDLVSTLQADAAAQLPPIVAEVVERSAEPFVQVLYDVDIPQMAFGRICLIGDAAFAVRPHTAAATAKAAADGWALAEAVEHTGGDVVAALKRWEPEQLVLGRNLLQRSRWLGDTSQFEGSWTPGDPALRFGLLGPGR